MYEVERVSISWKEMFAGDITQPQPDTQVRAYQQGKQTVTQAHAKARKTRREIHDLTAGTVIRISHLWLKKTASD